MKNLKIAFCLLGMTACRFALGQPHGPAAPLESVGVLTGIDVLEERDFDILKGKRVGLVTNQTGRDREGQATIDILRRARGVQLIALYAPEHGVRGEIGAGDKVKTIRDTDSGLPVFSLYGETRQPTKAMLRGVQTLVFDMQDIGSRSYTFLATLEKCRQACAINGIGLVVLDRPNPLGGLVEGNIPQSFSFVCPFPAPYRHGLTAGEVALWLNARSKKQCSVTVVPMRNYYRQPFAQTGLPWTRTSPNIPRPASAFFYSATGIIGEGAGLSIGIGTQWPFELAGAPGLNAIALANRLNQRHLAGWNFHAVSWVPNGGAYAHKLCQGVQIELTDARVAQTTRLNFEIYDAVRHVAPNIKFFKKKTNNAMFDKICGTTEMRRLMIQGQSANSLWAVWNKGAVTFDKQIQRFRLYR